MAKTESTAVTRLIELSQQRAVKGDFDWFAPQQPRRIAREEVTQVVRIARRALRVSPAMVAIAFLAGMLTVIVTTLVIQRPAHVPVAAPAALPLPEITVTAAPTPAPRAPIPAAVAIAAPETETETETATETATETETETETDTVAVALTDRRTPRAAAPPRAPRRAAIKPAPRTSRPPPQRDAGPLSELRINSKPPCELYIDGRRIGWTPQRGISVAPGRHTVVFRNREQGVERKVIVDAKVGEIHRLIRDFTEP